jgi:SAM-dependent methyltransferase
LDKGVVIPDDVVKYILFQRTGYIKYARGKLFMLVNKYGPWSYYEKAVALEAGFRKKDIKDLFQKDIYNEYLKIRDHLPATCDSVLDIGCGAGGIDLFLFRHYHQSPSLQFYLLDKTKINKRVFYNYKPKGAFYNSLPATENLLNINGIPGENIHLLEATEDSQIDIPRKVDLVISLISWGFHYPVSTYLERVYDLLQEKGRLIIDLRCDQQGAKELEQKFSSVTPIAESKNALRVLAIK